MNEQQIEELLAVVKRIRSDLRFGLLLIIIGIVVLIAVSGSGNSA